MVLEALRLRRWGLPLILSGRGILDRAEPPPTCSPEAWRLFLKAEACALPLARALGKGSDILDPAVRSQFERRKVVELQRAMSVQAQLQGMGKIAGEHGWTLAVLKGGLSIAEGHLLDSADVDVLALPEVALALAAELEDRAGYRPLKKDLPVGPTGSTNLSPRLAPGGVQIEIHSEVRGLGSAASLLARALPVPEITGLSKLSGIDHLFHLLWHGTLHHPERLGRIRDLELVTRFVAESPPERLESVRARIGLEVESAVIERTLTFAEAGTGAEASSDIFRLSAALRYLLLLHPEPRRLPASTQAYLAKSVFLIARGDGSYGRWLSELRMRVDSPSSSGALRRLDAIAPWLARSLRRAHRTVRAQSVYPLARRLNRMATSLTEVDG